MLGYAWNGFYKVASSFLAGAGCEGCYTPPLKKFPAGWFRGENQNVNSPVPASPLGSSPSATTAAPPRFTNWSGT